MRLVVIASLEPGRGRHSGRRAGGRREHVLRGEASAHGTAAVRPVPETNRKFVHSAQVFFFFLNNHTERHIQVSNGTHLPPEYPESWEKGVPERDVYGVPPPCEEHEEPGVYGPPREDGGVSRRCSPNPVSTEHGVVLPSGGTGI